MNLRYRSDDPRKPTMHHQSPPRSASRRLPTRSCRRCSCPSRPARLRWCGPTSRRWPSDSCLMDVLPRGSRPWRPGSPATPTTTRPGSASGRRSFSGRSSVSASRSIATAPSGGTTNSPGWCRFCGCPCPRSPTRRKSPTPTCERCSPRSSPTSAPRKTRSVKSGRPMRRCRCGSGLSALISTATARRVSPRPCGGCRPRSPGRPGPDTSVARSCRPRPTRSCDGWPRPSSFASTVATPSGYGATATCSRLSASLPWPTTWKPASTCSPSIQIPP